METVTIIVIVLLTIDIGLNLYTIHALRAYRRERAAPTKWARVWRNLDGP